MIDSSKLIQKVGQYQIATGGAVTDPVVLDIASQYETQVSRKMLALVPEQIAKRFPTNERVLTTTKVDGEGVFIYVERGKQPFLFNAPSGRVRVGLPALLALERHLLASETFQKGLFRAELYLPQSGQKRRSGIAEVLRASFNGTAEEVANFKLMVLDIIMLNGKDLQPNKEQFERTWDLLGELFGSDPTDPFHRPVGEIMPESQVAETFAQRVAAGEEGIVIRRLQRAEIYKIKPRLTIDGVVIGFVEGEFEEQYGVTSVLVALNYPISDPGQICLQTLVRVGSGLTDEQRADYLNLFSEIQVPSPLMMTDSDGRTITFIKPTYLVEISAEELMPNGTGSERPNRTQVFQWDPVAETYAFLGLAPCPRPTFATFVRLRQDKQLLEGGARIEQVLPGVQKPVLESQDPGESRVIRREVFVKGSDMVRKLVVTRKAGKEVVPFVIHWTDFSTKRKDKLKVTAAYAMTEERANALAEQLISENVVRGWSKYEG